MQVSYAPEGQERTKYLAVPGKLKSEGQITLKTYTKAFELSHSMSRKLFIHDEKPYPGKIIHLRQRKQLMWK